MAEISMLRQVWRPKIQLCWWHLRKAIRERLSKNKLTTTPYNVKRACLEAPFIDPKFTPIGSPDANEYEGLPPDPVDTIEEPYISANSIKVRISIPSSFQQPPMPENAPAPQITDDHLDVDRTANTALPTGQKLMIRLPARGHIAGIEGTVECEVIRTFCPSELREMIVDMMERHYCAHPLIPGYSHPSPQGIREWAVKQIYDFCVKHDLREAWAYLWENWYRMDRWKLWARSVHEDVPRLKHNDS